MKVLLSLIAITVLLGSIAKAQTPAPRVPVTIDSTRKATVAPQDNTATVQRAREAIVIKAMGFGTGVENRNIEGQAEEFPSNVGRIYFWTEITNTGDSTSVAHVWYHEGRQVSRVELPIRPLRNRTWSYKTIPPDWTGAWKVEVILPGNQVIAQDSCVVK